jgi:PPOX class probable FMN-dependent enzyme
MHRVETHDQLRALYPQPPERTRAKKRDRLDAGFRAIVEMSPFVLLATSDADGRCDVSPRGGPPGFVHVLDPTHLALPDLNGNHLLDSLQNIVSNAAAALLVIVPGQDDTLRISGRAHLSTDPALLDRFLGELRRPRLAIVVEVVEAYTHCAKAFRRGEVWRPGSWPALPTSPFLRARYDQLGLDESFEQYAATNAGKIDEGLAADRPC